MKGKKVFLAVSAAVLFFVGTTAVFAAFDTKTTDGSDSTKGNTYVLSRTEPDYAGMAACAESESALKDTAYIAGVTVNRDYSGQVSVYFTMEGTDALTAEQERQIREIVADAFNIGVDEPILYPITGATDVVYEVEQVERTTTRRDSAVDLTQ